MTGYTPHRNLPYPEGSDQVAVHSDVQSLAMKADSEMSMIQDATISEARQTVEQMALEQAQGAIDLRESLLDTPTNLINEGQLTTGYTYPPGSGVPEEASGYAITDWIAVRPATPYSHRHVFRITWFDSAGNYVDFENLTGIGEPKISAAPQNALWARLTLRTWADLGVAQMNQGTTLAPYQRGGVTVIKDQYLPGITDGEVTPDKTSFFDISSNLIDALTVTEGYVIPIGSGIPEPMTGWAVSGWILVTPGTLYTVTGLSRITWFNSARDYVGQQFVSPVTEAHTYAAPPGTTWARTSIRTVDLTFSQMNEGATLLPYEKGGQTIKPEHVPFGASPEAVKKSILLTDAPGLEQIYDAPTLDAQPELSNLTTATVYDWYDQLLTDHPDYVTKQDLGMSSDGVNALYSYTLTAPQVPTAGTGQASPTLATPIPAFILLAGVHGYELPPIYHTWRLAQALCEEWQSSPVLEAMRWNVEVIIVPVGSPYGLDHKTRTNANGVDIARNFTPEWRSGTEGTDTYGGPSPLSEPESIILDTLMQDHAARAVLGMSFHSFASSTERPQNMIWQAAADDFTLNLGKQLISRMSRKWKNDHAWITNSSTYYGYADRNAPPGSEGKAFAQHGIPGSTFEVSAIQRLSDTPHTTYGSRSMTLGYEAFANYVAMGIQAGINLKNRRQ